MGTPFCDLLIRNTSCLDFMPSPLQFLQRSIFLLRSFVLKSMLLSSKNAQPQLCCVHMTPFIFMKVNIVKASVWSAKSKNIKIFSMRIYHYILFKLNCNYCTFLTANYILSNKYYTSPNINYILLNKHCISPSANYTLLNKYCSLFDMFPIVIP